MKCWIFDNSFVANDVKLRDHCNTTGKYTGATHSDCYSNISLNYKIIIVFYKHVHRIMQELGKSYFKTSFTLHILEK